ncbi:MAG: TIGR03545 family protein [Calditrichales bacterium]|nr:TIGR03545 family protein [Calditrichales bacterium]
MFRWKGVIFLAVLAGIFFVLSLIFTDRWLESKMENTGSSIVGAKVEIDGLDLSFSGMNLSWNRLQVTDPKNTWTNIIETGKCEFNMEFWPLLSKKVIIENFQISEVRSNTERETDGKIPKQKQPSKPGFIGKTINRLSDKVTDSASMQFSGYTQKVNIDSIMQLLDIRSIKRIDSLQNHLTQQYDDWQKKLAQMDLQKDFKHIEADIKSINVKKIKTIPQLQKSLKTADGAKNSIDSLTKVIQTTKKNLLTDLNSSKSSLTQVDDWINEDYERARSMAKLPDMSAQNIGRMVFGSQLINQLNKYLGYADKAREYSAKLKSDKPEKEEPPRLKGQNIYFYNKNARPDFWIRQIKLSGETTNQIKIEGTILNIVSDQRTIGKTTDVDITGTREDGAALDFNGVFNYLEEKPSEKFNLKFAGFSLAHTKLSDSKFLPNQVEKGVGAVESSLNLTGENIDGKIIFAANKLVFDFAGKPKNKFDKIVQSIVQKTNKVDFVAKIKGRKDDLKFTLNSNLDDIFARNLKSVLNKEIEQAKQKIKSQIDKQVNKYREQLNQVVKKNEDQLKSELKKYERMLNDKLKMTDAKKKEIEGQIDKEKSKVEKELKNKLKDIFK